MDCITSLGLMNEAVSAWEGPLRERVKAVAAAETKAKRKAGRGWLHPVTAMFMPAFARAAEVDATIIARLRCARVALAVERFRLKEGRLPDSLEQLKPAFLEAVPEDPFDGKPLRYKKLGKGYLVYSIGPDGADNGGVEDKKEGRPDIVFKVER
jgi:hypothetical protein